MKSTISPEYQIDTSLPDINTSITTRNTRKMLVSHNRIQRKHNALGKPPLWIDTNKKYSIYPDAQSYKHGTANDKILMLREHLTRSNTVSNPNLLKEEQAIIDSMFNDKARQASRERSNYTSNIQTVINSKIKGKKRSQTKAPSSIELRGISSAAGKKYKNPKVLKTNRQPTKSKKKHAISQSKWILIDLGLGRQQSRENGDRKAKNYSKNLENVNSRKKLEHFSLLAKKNNNSKKAIGIRVLGQQSRKEVWKESDLTLVNASHDELDPEKNSSEIQALEHLSYINACARMGLLNANTKLLNYQILKKNTASNKQGNESNKSMDFTLTFRSDFNMNGSFNKDRRKTNINVTNLNILDENPVTLIKE